MIEPIYAALERGEKLNIYFELAEDFHGLDWGALVQDMKAAGSVGLKHRSSWQRMALVTDIDWVKYGASAFGWLAPGELGSSWRQVSGTLTARSSRSQCHGRRHPGRSNGGQQAGERADQDGRGDAGRPRLGGDHDGPALRGGSSP